MISRLIAAVILLSAAPGLCQEETAPAISGYVTRVASPTDFDVNGKHILLSPKIKLQRIEKVGSDKDLLTTNTYDLKPYLGEPLDIYGEMNAKTHTLAANRIVVPPRQSRTVTGFGIIDAVLPLPASAAPSTDLLIRADGYPILISAKTKTSFDKPLSSASDIGVNVWIAFRGVQRPEGVIVADAAGFRKNTISRSEDRLREKLEYDPAAVDPNAHQDPILKAAVGVNPKDIPPYKDDAMQARVSTIGAKLVPKYQFDFPYTEETRIDFRFQVIDSTEWRDAVSLPNGIILVPHQVVERMQNDSQLAAVLADNIACALEKQQVAALPLRRTALGTEAAQIAALAVPGLGLIAAPTELALMGVAIKDERLREEQSGRVSLTLLHDAGYDIRQAPLAWWLLAPRKPKDIADIPLPRRAGYLYQFLGETWPPN